MAKARRRRTGRAARRRRSAIVPHGVAHIQATFNNTIVSISDPEGNVLSWSSAGRIGFKGSRKGTPFAAQVAAQNAGNSAKDVGMRSVDVHGQGPGRRPRVGDPRAPGLGHRGQVDQGRDPDPAQRLPAAQAPPRLGDRRQSRDRRAPSGCAGAARRASSQVEVPVASGRGRQARRDQVARYTGPVCRLCRRERMKLFLKGDRCFKEKCAVERAQLSRRASTAQRRGRRDARLRPAAPREAEGQAHLRRARAPVPAPTSRRPTAARGSPARTCWSCSSGGSTTSSTASASPRRAPRRASSSATATCWSTARRSPSRRTR